MTPAEQQLLHSVRALQEATPNPRLREVLQALVRHIYELASELRLTREEWLAGLKSLNRTGQTSTADRDEFMLLSDVLGLSSLMDILHEQPGATAGTVLGPYHVPDSPQRENGACVIDTDDGGDRLTVSGVVRSMDGKPIPGALIDVWSCATNGLYPAQDSAQAPTNLRALITADDTGQRTRHVDMQFRKARRTCVAGNVRRHARTAPAVIGCLWMSRFRAASSRILDGTRTNGA